MNPLGMFTLQRLSQGQNSVQTRCKTIHLSLSHKFSRIFLSGAPWKQVAKRLLERKTRSGSFFPRRASEQQQQQRASRRDERAAEPEPAAQRARPPLPRHVPPHRARLLARHPAARAPLPRVRRPPQGNAAPPL